MQSKLIAERNCRAGDSVVAIVTALEESGSSSEEEVLDALESKYDALRDKLLAEALIQQVGKKWVSIAWICNYTTLYSVGCNHLSMPIPVLFLVLICDYILLYNYLSRS